MSKRTLNPGLVIAAAALLLLMGACEDTLLSQIEQEVIQAKLPSYTLSISDTSLGTVTPAGGISLKDGASVDIQAIEDSGYDFVRWEQVSGSGTAVFDDENALSTIVTLSGGSATIQAVWNESVDPTGSLTIDDKVYISGTYYRNNRTVNISLTFNDNSGSVPYMKLSGTSFAKGTGSGWQPAAVSTTYTFPSDGSKTVYARFKDGYGNESVLYSADVTIDTTPPSLSYFHVRHLAQTATDRDYVTGLTSSDIALLYNADDSGSGVKKVYFSNSSTRPASPQITDYSEPTGPYAWQISTNNTYYLGDHTVYVWFEDELGNVSSTPYSDTVRYDDAYEGLMGNNSFTADAVSGATMIMDSSSDRDSRLSLFTGMGSSYLGDPDMYKFGFGASDYFASLKFYWNTASLSNPRVRFYYYDWDQSDYVQISTDPPYDPDGSGFFDQQYDFYFPYMNVVGQQYFYLYVLIDRPVSAPYQYMNYQMWWNFQYNGI